MNQKTYTSCVKINGVPILPPLMTDDIREEMNYYKQLAIAVEDRLKSLQIVNKRSKDSKHSKSTSSDSINLLNMQEKSMNSSTDNSINSDTEFISLDTVCDATTIKHYSTKEKEIKQIITLQDEMPKSTKPSSDEESNCQQSIKLNDSVSSDAVTASTDLNQYFNESISTKTTTGETTPEIWKPQVPKTLDIVPITVESSKTLEDKPSSQLNRSDDNTPKIIRQGSYVLETPSPILLAHLQTELTNKEYIPTSTLNSTKRKEWNITQTKIEWENQIKNTDTFVIDSRKSTPKIRPRRNSASNAQTQKLSKSTLRTKHLSSLNVPQSAKSVDCIQAMLSREFSKNNGKSNKKSNLPINGFDNHERHEWKTSKSISILSLADKLEESLEFSKKRVEKTNGDETFVWKNSNQQSPKRRCQSSSDELKSKIPPEKLIQFFKEIQELHEKQMSELMEKQHKEQIKMQEDFKKQQLLLLMYIEKAVPGTLIPFQETFNSGTGNSLLLNKTTSINGMAHENGSDIQRCPLDYIYPPHNQNAQIITVEKPFEEWNTSTFSDQEVEKCETNEKKYLNISRQLFPLDSKTTLVPVIDNTLYVDKHHQAATVINAYARGYLVRRLMKSERVIELKNTYKEAVHCMLKLHVDAPLNLSELNFHRRLQLQCDAVSSNIVDLFAQDPINRMEIIKHDREIKKYRSERPSSARSYSFATQRTLARKKLKEYDTDMGDYQTPLGTNKSSCTLRARCQTWTSNTKEKRSSNVINQGIKRSTSAGAVRKPWR